VTASDDVREYVTRGRREEALTAYAWALTRATRPDVQPGTEEFHGWVWLAVDTHERALAQERVTQRGRGKK